MNNEARNQIQSYENRNVQEVARLRSEFLFSQAFEDQCLLEAAQKLSLGQRRGILTGR